MKNTTTLQEGQTVYIRRWAAQCFDSTYYYFREHIVSKNKKGKLFFKPLKSKCYGTRKNGTLLSKLPPTEIVSAGNKQEIALK